MQRIKQEQMKSKVFKQEHRGFKNKDKNKRE